MSLFTTAEQWPGATASAKKRLMQIDPTAAHIMKVRAAAESIGISGEAPFWRENAVAHLGFPDRKVAIFFTQGSENEDVARMRREWERHGFRLLGADKKKIKRATIGEVVDTLKSLL